MLAQRGIFFMHSQPIVEIRNAAVRRNGKIILDVSSLTIYEGEHVAVIGPNGSGKSTLVQLISKEVHPLWSATMRCVLFDKDRWNLLELRRHLGVVSESMQELCNTNFRVLDIVLSGFFSSIGLDFHHTVDENMKDAAMKALDGQRMGHLAGKSMRSLSSGEARRVLLARASLLEPEVMLLDEAVSNLDFPAKQSFRDSLKNFHRSNKTIILVTHDLSDIIEEINRVVVMKEGKIVADGSKTEVLNESLLSDVYGTRVFVSQREGRFTAWC